MELKYTTDFLTDSSYFFLIWDEQYVTVHIFVDMAKIQQEYEQP